MIKPSPITIQDIEAIQDRIIREYREFSSNLKRDGIAEMNISSGEETRYILELLQNADDAQLPDGEQQYESTIGDGILVFVLTPSYLYCANTGYPISRSGLKSLCDSFLSTKTRDKPTIGYKGIGFKSVLGLTETPAIFWHDGAIEFSKEQSWRIFSHAGLLYLSGAQENQIPILRYPIPLNLHQELNTDTLLRQLWEEHTTVFRFHFRLGVSPEDVWSKLIEITPSTLLFTHFLRKIEIRAVGLDYGGFSYGIERSQQGSYEQVTIHTEGDTSSWIVIRRTYDVSESERTRFPRDTQDVKTVEVALALEIVPGTVSVKPYGDGTEFPKLHVFFPTDQVLPFRILLHGNFRTNVDRRTVTDDPFNRLILKRTSALLAGELIDLIKARLAPSTEVVDFFDMPTLNGWFDETLSHLTTTLLKNVHVVPANEGGIWLRPNETLYLPACIDGALFRKLFPNFEFGTKKLCSATLERSEVRRRALKTLDGTELDPLQLPQIIQDYSRKDPTWVGESYALLEKTHDYMRTTGDVRYGRLAENASRSRFLLLASREFTESSLPREAGVVFAPPESAMRVLVPPGVRLHFLDRESVQTYLKVIGKNFRQTFLHEVLKVREYATDDVITGAILPEIRCFWQSWPRSTLFDPKKMFNFLLDLLADLLRPEAGRLVLSRETGTLTLQSIPVPVRHRDRYAKAYQVYFPKEWTGSEELEYIYGSEQSYFLDVDPAAFAPEQVPLARRLLEALGVSELPKIKGQFLPDQEDAWRQCVWERASRRFTRTPHAFLPGWNSYCDELAGSFERAGDVVELSKASTIALRTSYELDRFDKIVKDPERAQRLLKLLATKRAHLEHYLLCDIWYVVSKIPRSEKLPSYLAWQLRNTAWIPAKYQGRTVIKIPRETYLATPSLRRLFHDTIPYVMLTREMQTLNELPLFLRWLGARDSVDQLEPLDWWTIATAVAQVYAVQLHVPTSEEEIRTIYRAILDRHDDLDVAIPERASFLNDGRLLATKGLETHFFGVGEVWYTEIDRFEQLFDLPIFTIKRQYNRGPAIKRLFRLPWIEERVNSEESFGVELHTATEILNDLLDETAPYLLARLSVDVAASTQEQAISRLRKVRFQVVDGLTVRYTLHTADGNPWQRVAREEPVLLKQQGADYVLLANARLLPIVDGQLSIEAAHKIASELASLLRVSPNLAYEFAELLRKNELDRMETLRSAFGIGDETVEHFRLTLHEDASTIEVAFEPTRSELGQPSAPIPTPYETLPELVLAPVRVWSLDDLIFASPEDLTALAARDASTSTGHLRGSNGPGYQSDQDLRKAIEVAGQTLVERWLATEAGYSEVRPVQEEDRGWDIEAKKNGVTFFFEVKSSGSSVNVVEITMNEWKSAQLKRDKYFLVQVINLAYTDPETAKPPELIVIRNPYNVLAANPTRFRVKLSEFRRFDAVETKRIETRRFRIIESPLEQHS